MTDRINETDIAYVIAQTLNGYPTEGIECADVLYPKPEIGGNPAIVVTARDGSRYGLEVCPILEPHVLPNTPMGGIREAVNSPEARGTSGPAPDSPAR